MRRANARCDPIVSVPLSLTSDKTTIKVGDLITVSGKYRTNAGVIIYEDVLLGKEYATVYCNSAGDYNAVIYLNKPAGIYNIRAKSAALLSFDKSNIVTITVTAAEPICVSKWVCEQPLNGYETDGCGKRGWNTACVPLAQTGSIVFVSTPPGAGVFLDGADQTSRTPIQIFNIPAGKHAFMLKLAGFNDTTGEVTVTGGGTVQAYANLSPLTPAAGSLSFYSTPPGAEIFIDDTDQKTITPATVTGLIAGTHKVRLTLSGYLEWTGTVLVTAGQTAYLNPALTLLGSIGALEISSVPAGARVFIDGIDAQKVTPATITNPAAGEHTYRLALPGYNDHAGKFTIETGKTTPVSVTLAKSAGVGIMGISLLGLGVIGAVVYASRENKPEYTLPARRKI